MGKSFYLLYSQDSGIVQQVIGQLEGKTNASISQSNYRPIGISEFELEKLYPTKVEGMIPTIEELEDKLNDRLSSEEKENPSEDDKQ